MDDVVIARALHVLFVVIWIGGVSMATTVVLPAVRRGDLGADWLQAFQAIEHRFAWQARTAIVVVGLLAEHGVAVRARRPGVARAGVSGACVRVAVRRIGDDDGVADAGQRPQSGE